jgi:hypothetical protein
VGRAAQVSDSQTRLAREAHAVNFAMPQRPDPLPKLRRLAESLGWKRLRKFQFNVPDEVPTEYRIVTYYVSDGKDVDLSRTFMQINESPIGRKDQYLACVYAIPYRLCSGWHFFRLPRGRTATKECVEKLAVWLARSNFSSLDGRRAYRAAHPETTGYMRKFLSSHGEPYIVSDGQAGITCRNTLEGRLEAARGDRNAIRRIRRRFSLRR